MKKYKFSVLFLDELRKIPIVQVACEKSGLSRNTIYRWRKEDVEFTKIMDETIQEGIAYINDMAESQMIELMTKKEWSAISFWLKHRHASYKNKVEVTTKEDTGELTAEQSEIINRALELSGLVTTNEKRV